MKLKSEKEIIGNWKKNIDPLVSISCVTFNHENYIGDCLDSFLLQETDFPFEVLIHDDASTDATSKIINSYVEKYPNLIFPIFQKINQYSQDIKPNLYNFERAKGKYIAFCDGDDFWSSKKKLSIQVDYMKEYKNCHVSFHGVKVLRNDNRVEERLTNIKPHIYSLEEIILKDHHLVFSSSSIMITSDVVNNIPNFYKIAPVEDYYLRILGAINGGGLYIPEILTSYEVKKYLNKSIFSIVGFKVVHFLIKFLILNFYNKLKNR